MRPIATITRTPPARISIHAHVITRHIGYGEDKEAIAWDTGLTTNSITRIIKKYYPKRYNKNVTITLQSKV